MKQFSIISLAAFVAICVAACGPSSNVPVKYVGLWACDNGQLLGLYEEFAIYGNDFWEYQDVGKSGDALNITLSKGSQVQNISVDYLNDSVISISQDSMARRSCKRMSSHWATLDCPAGKDTAGFKPLRNEIDSATILYYCRFSGYGIHSYVDRIGAKLGRELPLTYLWYYDTGTALAEPEDPDARAGFRYKFKVPVQGVTEIPCCFDRNYYYRFPLSSLISLIVEPGDTLVIVDDDKCSLLFGGSQYPYCNSLAAFDRKQCRVEDEYGVAHYYGPYTNSFCPGHGYHYMECEGKYLENMQNAMRADSISLCQFLGDNPSHASRKFADLVLAKIKSLALSAALENDSPENVFPYFRDSVEFDESRLYHCSPYWELSTQWIRFCYKRIHGHEMDPRSLDFLDSDFVCGLGFSRQFYQRWLVLNAVQYIKEMGSDRPDASLAEIRQRLAGNGCRDMFEQIAAPYLALKNQQQNQ